jgi:nucleolar protein 6
VGDQVKQAEKRKAKKGAEPETAEDELARLTAGKRFSATAGVEEAPTKKRTWTVGDAVEDPHRGGAKHKKERKRGARVKSHASGMNAIPVG